MIIKANTLVIITEQKLLTLIYLKILTIFEFDLHEFDFIIKQKYCLADHTIKNEISQLLSKYKHENSIHEKRKQ